MQTFRKAKAKYRKQWDKLVDRSVQMIRDGVSVQKVGKFVAANMPDEQAVRTAWVLDRLRKPVRSKFVWKVIDDGKISKLVRKRVSK